MLSANELRPGMAIRLEGAPYKVVASEYHAGGGKMGGVTHARLLNLGTGTLREWRFRAGEPIEKVELDRHPMQFLYRDETASYFMNIATYEQVAVDNDRVGATAAWLTEGTVVSVEFIEDQPVSVVFPGIVEATITETAPPSHTQGTDNVWKPARLENGVAILVPPFIAPGEHVRVDVAAGRYVERAHADHAHADHAHAGRKK